MAACLKQPPIGSGLSPLERSELESALSKMSFRGGNVAQASSLRFSNDFEPAS